MDGNGMGRTGGDYAAEESAGKADFGEAAQGDWKTTSVSFRKAENGGIIANCSKERTPGKGEKDAPYDSRYQNKDYAFGSVDDAAEFLKSEMGGASATASTHGGAVPSVR